MLLGLNAAGVLSYKQADFNNLRWLKGSVIILSLVKTGSRISSVSFYTPEPPHSSCDWAEVLLRPLEVDAKTKSSVRDGLRVQLAPIRSQWWGEKVKCAPGHESRAFLPSCWTHFIHWKLRVIPGRYGRTYVFLHHREVRWGPVSYLHKYLVCAETLDGPWRSKYWRNLAHRRGATTFLQASFVWLPGKKKKKKKVISICLIWKVNDSVLAEI